MTLNDPIVSPDQKIGESSYTISWLLKILNLHDDKWTYGEDIRSLTAIPRDVLISKDKGYASKIYSVRLTIGEKLHHVIAKLPSAWHMNWGLQKLHEQGKMTKEECDEQCKKNFDMIASVHNRELDFYKLAQESFKGLHLPKFIYGEEMHEKQEGIVLMEDFSDRCAKDISNFRGFSKNQILPIVEDLARMQCQSLNIPDLDKTFKQQESAVLAVSKYSLMCANMLADKGHIWLNQDVAKKLLEIAHPEKMFELFSAQQEVYGMPPVLVHGDLWPGNLLWEKEDGEDEAKMLAILDWQACHVGSFTTDLANLINVSMEAETRRKDEKAILEFFYAKLQEYKKLSSQEFDLTFEQVQKSYKKSLQYALLPMVMTVATNPHEDVVENGETEGVLTKRLKYLLEDVLEN